MYLKRHTSWLGELFVSVIFVGTTASGRRPGALGVGGQGGQVGEAARGEGRAVFGLGGLPADFAGQK